MGDPFPPCPLLHGCSEVPGGGTSARVSRLVDRGTLAPAAPYTRCRQSTLQRKPGPPPPAHAHAQELRHLTGAAREEGGPRGVPRGHCQPGQLQQLCSNAAPASPPGWVCMGHGMGSLSGPRPSSHTPVPYCGYARRTIAGPQSSHPQVHGRDLRQQRVRLVRPSVPNTRRPSPHPGIKRNWCLQKYSTRPTKRRHTHELSQSPGAPGLPLIVTQFHKAKVEWGAIQRGGGHGRLPPPLPCHTLWMNLFLIPRLFPTVSENWDPDPSRNPSSCPSPPGALGVPGGPSHEQNLGTPEMGGTAVQAAPRP